uniref:Uncharacterized protein n=1 Tax=Arion vulgaris TaxID=1028688 RepID=A0A0B7A1S0_9EUPU
MISVSTIYQSGAYQAQRNKSTLNEDCGTFDKTTSSMTTEITAGKRKRGCPKQTWRQSILQELKSA